MESHNLYENHTDKVSTVTKNSQQVKGHYGDKLKEMQLFLNQMSNALQQDSSLLESKEHTIDIQEKTNKFVQHFQRVLFDKNGRSSEFLLNFYECCYKFYQERSLKIKSIAIIQHCKLFPSFVHLR